MAKLNISVQLYTLRDATSTDLPGVLKSLKKIGYAGAELAGYGSLRAAAEVRKAFDDAGLKVQKVEWISAAGADDGQGLQRFLFNGAADISGGAGLHLFS